jgi:hypothetical protein
MIRSSDMDGYHVDMPRAETTLATALVVALALATGSCGGSSTNDDGATPDNAASEQRPLASEDKLVQQKLVTADDVARFEEGSVERAFADYWSAISNEEWSVAVDFYSTKVRRVLQAQYLVPALRIEGQNNVPVKPLIRGVNTSRGHVTVRFFVRTATGRLRPTSMAWERREGLWYIAYSSTLDDSYGAAVQQAVQSDVAPDAKKVAAKAASAGAGAARTQATTLDIKP